MENSFASKVEWGVTIRSAMLIRRPWQYCQVFGKREVVVDIEKSRLIQRDLRGKIITLIHSFDFIITVIMD